MQNNSSSAESAFLADTRPPKARRLRCTTSTDALSRLHDYLNGDESALPHLHAQKLQKHVSTCDECSHYTAQFARLSDQLGSMHQADIQEADADTTWLEDILHALTLDIHRGELIALEALRPEDKLGIYEGAVRAITRRVGSTNLMIIASSTIEFIDKDSSALRVNLEAYVAFPTNIKDQAQATRSRVWNALQQQNGLDVREVNLHIADVIFVEPSNS